VTGRPVTGRRLTGRQGLLGAVLGTAAAGGLLLLAAGRTWGHADVQATGGARVSVSVTGGDVAPALPALGVALLVLAVAVLAARSWLRRVVGLAVVVVGGAAIAVAATARDDVAAELTRQAFVATEVIPPSTSGWALVAVFAGALGGLAGALTVFVGARWPTLGSRYDAPAARPRDETVSAWEALDRGDDPTT
jgi:uncharacterized membrane protein (TIGR02234 family)